MKLKQIIEATEPLKRLSEKRLASYKKMRELVKLRKSVEQELEFYKAEESKCIDVYAEKDSNGNPVFLDDGRIQLKDLTAKIAFEKEIDTLRNTDIDGIEPVSVTEDDFLSPGDYPTINEMLSLEGIVNFED